MFDDMFDEDTDAEEGGQSLLPPQQSLTCIGHDAIETQMLEMIAEDRVHHAMIFTGLPGIGKSTFAFRLARYLLANPTTDESEQSMGLFGEALPEPAAPETLDIDPEGPVYRQVAAGSHPDLFYVYQGMDESKKSSQLDVETIRKITPFVRLTASEPGAWRVVIVDDADSMNRNAQNAILKNLEEPPKNTVFILVSHRLGALIPTVRSRSRVFHFKPLDYDRYADLVRQQAPATEDQALRSLYEMTSGSVGRTIAFLEEDGLETMALVSGLLNDWPQWNWPAIHATADTLSRKGQETQYQSFTDILLWVAETILRAKARNQADIPSLHALEGGIAQRLLSAYSLEEWIKICENLKEHLAQGDRAHLDKRNIILGTFSILSPQRKAA